MKNLFISLLLLQLTACAIVSKKDCAEFDWSQKAKDDLHRNRNWEEDLVRYEKVCTRHGYSIKEAYMNGVEAKGGKLCTGYQDFSEKGWSGVGVRDALSSFQPAPDQYTGKCAKYKIVVNMQAYNEGVKSVGARACSSFEDYDNSGWAGVGARDANAGSVNNLETYIERCKSSYFTEVNEIDFNNGYKEGLKIFCNKKSGFEFAKKGGSYNRTCSLNEKSFLKGFKIGSEVRKADLLENSFKSANARVEKITEVISVRHSEIENLNAELTRQLSSYQNSRDSIESDISMYTRRLNSENDPDRQKDISDRLQDLREDAVKLEDETLKSETSTKRALEEARFAISKLREERRQIDRNIPNLESAYREARSRADKSLKGL